METNLTLTIGSVLLAVALLIFLWVTKQGVLPLLKAISEFIVDMRAVAQKRVMAVDNQFAESNSMIQTVIHDVAKTMRVEATDTSVLAISNVLTEGLKLAYKILPETPEHIPPEQVAQVANQVAEFIAKLTDNVKNNAMLPPIEGDPPALG